jgi:predicted site-specific integrase-resolvase
MAAKTITYLDLPLDQRKKAAIRVREQIRSALSNPFLSADQRTNLTAQIDRITKWEQGTLEVGAAFTLVVEPKS